MLRKTVKGFILGLSTALIIGGASLTVSAANGTFKDVVAGEWYETTVLWAQEKGLVNGYPDDTFKPNNPITRAELTGVVQNLASAGYIDAGSPLESEDSNDAFKDVTAGEWYENAVLWAQEKGLVNGYPDGTFKPNNPITRAELTGVMQNLASKGYIDADIPLKAGERSVTVAFKDVAAGEWYENAVLWAQEKGVVNGYPDDTFKPNNPITRAELTTVMQNLAVINGWDPNIIYEKFKAIKVGETTREELEKLFGRKLPDKVPTTLEYQSGSYTLVDSNKVGVGVEIVPYTPSKYATQVVSSKNFYSPIKDEAYIYPQVTKENFNKLEWKMNYESVSALLGGPGKLVSEYAHGQSYLWYSSTEDKPISASFSYGELWLWRIDLSPIKDETYIYPQATKENYDKIEENMSYESVSALLGGPGKLVSVSNSPSSRTETYYWYGTEDKTIEVSFTNRELGEWRIDFSPIKDEAYIYPQTTKENYNKLEWNMNYESVSALLGGPGKLVSEYNSRYERIEKYCWYSTEDKTIEVSFVNGEIRSWEKND